MFCSVFPSGSDETIVRVKRSFGVILAIFGHFCKIEKACIGAISWADICSVSTPLSRFKNSARWHPMQKIYSRFHFYGYHATYIIYDIRSMLEPILKHFTQWFYEPESDYQEKNKGCWLVTNNIQFQGLNNW